MGYFFLRPRNGLSSGPVDSGGDSVKPISAGDALYSTGAGLHRLLDPQNSVSFVGICTAVYPSAYHPAGGKNAISFLREGVVAMQLNAGDSIAPGAACYIVADNPQMVTTVKNGAAIGFVAFDQSGVPGPGMVAMELLSRF